MHESAKPKSSTESPEVSQPSAPPAKISSGMRGLLAMGLFMLVGTMFLVWLGTPAEQPPEGQPVANLDLKPLLNSERGLSEADLQGKISVLHFWGTWCGPCREEFPEFVKISKEFAEQADVQFIAVSCSSGAEFDLAKLARETQEFIAPYAPNLPIYCDPAAMSRMQIGLILPRAVFGYPCTVVTDREGKVAGVWQGYTPLSMQEVLLRVKKLQALPAVPEA